MNVRGLNFTSKSAEWLHRLARQYLPGSLPLKTGSWTPHDFYENVHVPDKNETLPEALQAEELETELYPFQKRAVQWLLRKEGMRLSMQGQLVSTPQDSSDQLSSFTLQHDTLGRPCRISHLLEQVRPDDGSNLAMDLKGGILAEEMGLGKTVEIIALILLHKRTGVLNKRELDPYSESQVRPSKATLIITPPNILGQWQSELARHSPRLKVYHYEGIQKDKRTTREISKHLCEQDVVLTTYSVLAKEVHYARPPPDRALRHEKAYEARRSPLVDIHWWRVCLDEAQMVENGVSNAATVARLIPRVNAWAVSGTPLKKDIKDLLGLLIFLRYEPYCHGEVWSRLIRSYHDILAALIGTIALRHTKSKLRDELTLPPQKRVTITCSFTAVESQRYHDLYREMCEDIGVDETGGPLTNDWNPQSPVVIEKMRQWLSRLRTTCLHAEIGSRNRRALGTKSGPLRTIDEVLDVMIDQNEIALRTQQRVALSHSISRGQLMSFGHQPQQALDIFKQALKDATSAVKDCRKQLADAKLIHSATDATNAEAMIATDSAESDSDESMERHERLSVYRQRLRSALEMQHICYFFTATGYFQVKDNKDFTEPDSDAWKDLEKREAESYDEAKLIRKELLSNVSSTTSKLMEKVALAKSHSLVAFSQIQPIDSFRGLESRKITEKIETLRLMVNDYAQHMSKWRSRLVDLLVANLLDQEDVELTGEEYEETTKQQDEQYVLLEALRAGLADRQCAITGQLNVLINHEMKVALKYAKDGQRDNPDDKGPAPELFREILLLRQASVPAENLQIATPTSIPRPTMSFRGLISDIRSMITAVQWQDTGRSKAEATILERELHNLQTMSAAQVKETERFEKELDLFRSTMLQRLEFYRQLQQISDTVRPLQEETTDVVDQQRLSAEQAAEDKANERLSALLTKKRFLGHLKAQGGNQKDQRYCVICQDQFEIGILTVCGHQYCKECITCWWHAHRTCPMCKQGLKPTDFHQVTYKPQELRAQEEISSPSSEDEIGISSAPAKSSIYSDVSESTLSHIKSIDLPGQSYGVKIDMISRHLLWLRHSDPGSKSIIFSQYRDFLTVLGSAFQSHKIGYAEIGAKNGVEQFRNDPSKDCFLLHAKADSSGLNLVNATHVFLCEPLVNAAIELQAIARVHRIGQQRPTTVWMYLVSDTVEEAVYDVSVARRLEHMQKGTTVSQQPSRAVTPSRDTIEEDILDNANSMELQSTPISQLLTTGKNGGEVVHSDDLWKCLFGKTRRTASFALDAVVNGHGPASREMGAFLRAEAADAREAVDHALS